MKSKTLPLLIALLVSLIAKAEQITIPAGQYLDESGTLELYPSDIVHLEFENIKGKLINPKVVPKVQKPKQTLTFKMTQESSITMVIRETGIQKTVGVDCTHRGLGDDKFYRTNLNPTSKGIMIGDSWPSSVWTIRINNIEVTDKSASEVYDERIKK